MTGEEARRFVARCSGMSDDEIIAAHHAEFFDKTKPHVREAFEQMGIDEHEVSAWVSRNIK